MIQAMIIVLTATVPLAVGLDATIRVDAHGQRAAAPRAGTLDAPAPAEQAGGAGWAAIGPFGGDAQDVAVSTVDASIVLAGIAPSSGSGGALYRSTDSGSTWSIVADLSGVNVYDIEFATDGTVYISTQEAYKGHSPVCSIGATIREGPHASNRLSGWIRFIDASRNS